MITSAASPAFPLQIKDLRGCSFTAVLPPLSRQCAPYSWLSFCSSKRTSALRVQCTRGQGSGNVDSKSVLDAFFLGKALAEAVTERIESAVGEFVSTLGRIQAEQQKQVQDLQGEILQRARKAKEKAALEALEEQGLVPKSAVTPAENGSPGGSSPSARNDDLFQEME